jgi:hypothetical protein
MIIRLVIDEHLACGWLMMEVEERLRRGLGVWPRGFACRTAQIIRS